VVFQSIELSQFILFYNCFSYKIVSCSFQNKRTITKWFLRCFWDRFYVRKSVLRLTKFLKSRKIKIVVLEALLWWILCCYGFGSSEVSFNALSIFFVIQLWCSILIFVFIFLLYWWLCRLQIV